MNVRVTCANGKTTEFPAGTPVREAAAACIIAASGPLVAARLNNEVVSLESALTVNCVLSPVELDSKEGVLIYRKSLCFLLAMAAKKAFPEAGSSSAIRWDRAISITWTGWTRFPIPTRSASNPP